MTQNEENFIKKINELQNVIEWQKKAIAQRDDELSIQTSIIDAMAQPKTCEGCSYAVHDVETNDYSYYSNSDTCKTCARSGYEDNYKLKVQ